MAKVTPMDKEVAVKNFSKIRTRAILDWSEDERRGVPLDERRRAWWSKDEIIRICEWPGKWRPLRELLAEKVGLIWLHDGKPTPERVWTYAVSEADRRRMMINAASMQYGITKMSANVMNRQIAPPDKRHAITDESRDKVNDILQEKYGTTLRQMAQAISRVRSDLLLSEVRQLMDGHGGE